MTNSIVQTNKECFLCGRKTCLERHHIYAGVANRRLSEREGLWLWLCADCHRGTDGGQYNKERNLYLKQEGQRAFEETHTREEFMKIFGKNYL